MECTNVDNEKDNDKSRKQKTIGFCNREGLAFLLKNKWEMCWEIKIGSYGFLRVLMKTVICVHKENLTVITFLYVLNGPQPS